MTSNPAQEFPAELWGVRIRVGEVPEKLEGITRDDGFLQVSADAFLFKTEDVGDMLVTRDEIVLAPHPNSTAAAMDYMVYGWAPRFIRVLRREFSIHASAVVIDGGAIAVMGPAMAGKSTTVVGLIRRGHPLLIDDVLPVDFHDGVPIVHGWDRPIHLRESTADHFDVPHENLVVTPVETKVQLRVPSHAASTPLRCLIELKPDAQAEGVTIRKLSGVEALRACMGNTNATGLSSADGRGVDFFTWLTNLVNAVPIYQLTRPEAHWSLDSVLDEIEAVAKLHTQTPQETAAH